jgi:hydroxymethylpyrimidine pyrophosphatase-like HAD family hydrolase
MTEMDKHIATNTLYISDLDGTLLKNNKTLSTYSVKVLNELIDGGAAITVASARSLMGIHKLPLNDVHFQLPMVLMNGVILYDYAADHIIDSCIWEESTAAEVLKICIAGGKTPFLYRVVEGKMETLFTRLTSEGERIFYKDRVSLFPDMIHQGHEYPLDGAAYYTMQDRYEVLAPIKQRLEQLPNVN